MPENGGGDLPFVIVLTVEDEGFELGFIRVGNGEGGDQSEQWKGEKTHRKVVKGRGRCDKWKAMGTGEVGNFCLFQAPEPKRGLTLWLQPY